MRSKQQLESRVLTEVERAQQHRRGDEDFTVELKRQLPADHKKAARQIAAICNAANGNDVLWIIGVDGATGTLVGLDSTDIQAWWPSVRKHFDDIAPDLLDLVVPITAAHSAIGLLFETGRAPYVVKTDGRGAADREVPWREATTTRSAYRRDLLRILAPSVAVPDIEMIHASFDMSGYRNRGQDAAAVHIHGKVDLFVHPHTPVSMPMHLLRGVMRLDNETIPLNPSYVNKSTNAQSGISGSPEAPRVLHLSSRSDSPGPTVRRQYRSTCTWIQDECPYCVNSPTSRATRWQFGEPARRCGS
jgi:hypothetical protein